MKIRLELISLLAAGIVGFSACEPDAPRGEKATAKPVKSTIVQSTTPSATKENTTTLAKPTPNELTFNETTYNYDVVTGATRTTFGSNPKPLYPYEEKLGKMFWSNQPPLGLLMGNYFTNEGTFDVGNKGIVEVVTDSQGKILSVEFQEYGAPDYYESKYAGANKRLSDYAFFQAKSPRTDETLVTVVNGITFVEEQMRKENRLAGNFKTVKGSSTTARQGLMAIASELAPVIRQPSPIQYLGYAEDFGNGLIGRIQLTTENGKILTARYDEYFADQPENIQEPQLKPYYRQSKYYSLTYNEATNHQFKKFSDQLTKTIVDTQSLTITDPELLKNTNFANYQRLFEKLPVDQAANGN